ncbi:MAG: DUF4340 domain-containing protein [Desulfobacteraceae bacterium]|nr:DUF4340 domain-containing protein [Desulfobacteraceae bacterium]
MKAKKEYIVLALIIAALAAYLVLHETGRVNYRLPELEKYPDTEITRIQIKQPDGVVTLEKNKDQWYLADKDQAADKNKVRAMIETIGNLELTAVVSEGSNYPNYSLGKQRRIHVTAWAGDKRIRAFDVGKTAPSYKHTFVKLPDDPRVYHASGSFRKQFAVSKEELRPKQKEKSGQSKPESKKR